VFPLGHLGFGLQTAKPFRRDLPLQPLLIGTLLPDLIDKPLYYGLSFATGRHGPDLGIVAGTRSFGHTVLFTTALALAGAARRSKVLTALALGAATHLVLDLIGDFFESGVQRSLKTLAWPLLGWQFPFYAKVGMHEHLLRIWEPFILCSEIVGGALLIWEWRRSRRTL
jgi:hypothetical protein